MHCDCGEQYEPKKQSNDRGRRLGAKKGFLKQVWPVGSRISDGIARLWMWCCVLCGWMSAVAGQEVRAVKRHNADAGPTEWERGEGENGLHNSKLE